MTPVIEVSGLTAHTGSRVLLDGVGLTVEAGEVTALVGPSGSGKTTTALALLGEHGPGVRLSGSVRVAGTPVVDGGGVTREAAALHGGTLAYMPQHPGEALNPARRIGTVLAELARLHGESPGGRRRAHGREQAAEALRRAQLEGGDGLLRRFPHQFSGGQRQRVVLAEVLACAPSAVILDEPGTGLDTVTRAGLTRELAALTDAGIAVLLLSHDHGMVRALAHHAVLLDGGRVQRTGPPAKVLPRRGPVLPPEPQESGPELLRAEHLTAWLRPRGQGEVLHGVELTLSRGGALGVAGRSGSGKTTLARCLAGLHERHSGRLMLGGAPLPVLRRRDRRQKRRVQYVWQEVRGSFDDHRPVLAQVARTAVRLREVTAAEAHEEAAALLERLGVSRATAGKPPALLSGGELQRAAFARAALARPDVLVCDEVTTSLDGDAEDRVLAEVARMRSESGTAVLWVGHDLDVMSRVAERLMVLDDGEVVEEGATRDVLGSPRAGVTRQLLDAARPVSPARAAGATGTTVPGDAGAVLETREAP